MKNMKKFVSLLLAAVMTLSMMTVNVFAEDTATGKITITDAKANETYSVYRIFDLTLGGEYEEDNTTKYDTYSYLVTSTWAPFFEEEAAGYDYIELDNHGYVVETKEGMTAAAFAEEAAVFAASVSATETQTTTAGGELVFDNLPLGYYLVTSTYGSSGICILKSTDKNVEVTEKNMQPILKKEVKEDSKSGDAAWGEVNDAEYGEVVDFRITITVEENASGYVLTDELPDNMTLVANSINVDLPVDGTVTPVVADDNKGFTIDFGTLDTAKAVDIVVTYSATVDTDAPVNTALVNTATLNYDEDGDDEGTVGDVTIDATTETYTWNIPVKKVNSDDETLAGAKFVLKNADNEYYCYDEENGVTWVAEKGDAVEKTTPDSGVISFEGLDSGTYYLEETAAPEGYNMLTSDIEVVVDGVSKAETDTEANIGSLHVKMNADDEETSTIAKGVNIEVENNTGAELPETGGIGTTIFYVAGGIMVIGAATMLLRRRYN